MKAWENTYISGRLFVSLLLSLTVIFILWSLELDKDLGATVTSKPYTPHVGVLQKTPSDQRLRITVHGKTAPSTVLPLSLPNSGIFQGEAALTKGSIVLKGTLLGKIESKEQLLNVDKSIAALRVAEADLAEQRLLRLLFEKEQPEGRKYGAATYNGEDIRKIRLDRALAVVDNAKINVKQAKLDLLNSELRAPFDAYVYQVHVSNGEYIDRDKVIATLYSTDYAKIEIPLSQHYFSLLNIPEQINKGVVPRSTIVSKTSNSSVIERNARVSSYSRSLDPIKHTYNITVILEDPLGIKQEEASIFFHKYVDITIDSPLKKDVFIVPNTSISSDNRLVTVLPENKLKLKLVDIIFRQNDLVYINHNQKETVVERAAPSFIDGMSVVPFNIRATEGEL